MKKCTKHGTPMKYVWNDDFKKYKYECETCIKNFRKAFIDFFEKAKKPRTPTT